MFSTLVNSLSRVRKRHDLQMRRNSRPSLERLEKRELPAAFIAGDIVVSRVGTGTALTSNATETFLDEYNPTTMALVQSIALPTAAGNALTEGGTFSSEGRLTAAADGHTLSIAGYQQIPGGSISGVNGVVGVVNPDGTVGTTTQIPFADLGSSESVRATASADGLGFWVTTSAYVRYVPLGNSGSTSSIAVSNYFPSPTAPAISPSGQLYVDGGAGAQSNGVPAIDGPTTIGTKLPINAGQTGSVLPGFPTNQDAAGGFPSSQQFAISPDGNTIFVADGRTDNFGGILEFFQSTPGSWLELGHLQAGTGSDSGLRGLAADFSGTVPVLYATTTGSSANRVVKITGGTLDGSAPSFNFTTLATAAANEVFRGVGPAPTVPGATTSATTLSVTGSPSDYGTGVTLTATMDGAETGWVSFQQNGVEIGAAPLVSGTATFNSAGNLGAGTYSNIVAVYTGDSTFAASTSAAQSATINQVAATTTLTESANPVATGVGDTLTATIAPPAATAPTGTVTFMDGATTLGTGTVSQVIVNQGGLPVIKFLATFTASFSTIGTHTLSAVYNGDSNFTTSTGTDSVLVVNATTTTVTTSDPNPTANPTSSVTLTATVSSTGGTPTGTVQFYDNLIAIGSPVTLDGSGVGTATISTALVQAASSSPDVLTPGLHSISAVYTPDPAAMNTFFTSTGVYEQAVQAQTFGAGDVFVYRVGDGTNNLIAPPGNPNAGAASIGSTIFVDEYTSAGTLVQSIILPTADGTGSQSAIHAVVGNGQQSTTEQLSLSGDGQYLFLVGYDTNPLNIATAPAIPTGPGSASVPRAVAQIKYDGTVQTIGLSGVQTGGNFNGIFSPDGNQFYVSGANGVSYFSSFVPSATLQTATATITSTSYTVIGLQNAGGDLVAVGASSNLVQKYTGFPTSAATQNALPGVSTTTDPNQTFVIDVFFTHLNGTGAPAGINTMYLSDDGPGFAHGQITKWSFDGTTWTLVDQITAGTGNSAISFYWMAGQTDASGNVTLDVTYGNGGNSDTGPGELYSISDTNGWNAPIGTGGTHSDAAPRVAFVDNMSNEVFRGVAFAPSAPPPAPRGGGAGHLGGALLSAAGSTVFGLNQAAPLANGLSIWDLPNGGVPLSLALDGNHLMPSSSAGGVYDLPVHAGSVSGAASGTAVLSVDRVDAFFRLFDESAGDGAVGSTDNFLF
jgi:hypothetical protein